MDRYHDDQTGRKRKHGPLSAGEVPERPNRTETLELLSERSLWLLGTHRNHRKDDSKIETET
jgi:hypothetical protein